MKVLASILVKIGSYSFSTWCKIIPLILAATVLNSPNSFLENANIVCQNTSLFNDRMRSGTFCQNSVL